MESWGQGSYKNGNKNSAAQRGCRFEGVEGRSAREISESSLLQTGGRTGTAVRGGLRYSLAQSRESLDQHRPTSEPPRPCPVDPTQSCMCERWHPLLLRCHIFLGQLGVVQVPKHSAFFPVRTHGDDKDQVSKESTIQSNV